MPYEGLLIFSVYMLAGFALLGAIKSSGMIGETRIIFQILLLVATGLYFIMCWYLGKQTLPMKAWKIRLAAIDGRPLSLLRLVLRFSLAILSVTAFGLGYAWAFVDPDRQFLHDRLSGTRIVASLP